MSGTRRRVSAAGIVPHQTEWRIQPLRGVYTSTPTHADSAEFVAGETRRDRDTRQTRMNSRMCDRDVCRESSADQTPDSRGVCTTSSTEHRCTAPLIRSRVLQLKYNISAPPPERMPSYK